PLVPGLRAGLRHDSRRAGGLHFSHRLLSLPAGLHVFPHGLRQRRRLRAVRHHLRADAASVQILRQAGRGITRGRAPSPTPMLQHGLLLAAVVITLLPYAWMVSSSLKANADI